MTYRLKTSTCRAFEQNISAILKRPTGKREKNSRSMAKHGHDGGLLRVIQDLRDTIVQDYAQTEIEGRVWSFWPT